MGLSGLGFRPAAGFGALGFRVWAVGFGAFGFRVWAVGFGALRFRVQGSGLRVWGLPIKTQIVTRGPWQKPAAKFPKDETSIRLYCASCDGLPRDSKTP